MANVRSLASRFEQSAPLVQPGTLFLSSTTSRVATGERGSHIHAVKAGRSLAAKDLNGLSDPYCVVNVLDANDKPVKSMTKKTNVISKSLNPTWNGDAFQFAITESMTAVLIEVWDEDKIGTHDFMGQVKLSLSSDIAVNRKVVEWFPLVSGVRKTKVSGDIKVELEFKTKRVGSVGPRSGDALARKAAAGARSGTAGSSTAQKPFSSGPTSGGRPSSGTAPAGVAQRKFIKVSLEGEQTHKTIVVTPQTTLSEAIDMILKRVCKGVPKDEQKILLDRYASWNLYDPVSKKQISEEDSIYEVVEQHNTSETPTIQFRPPGSDASSTNSSGMEVSNPIVKKTFSQSKEGGAQQTAAVVEMLAGRCNDLQVENEKLKKKVEQQRMSRRGNQKNKLVVDLSNVEVQERLAAIGGSLASVYSVYVDGWMCAMKEVFIENPEDAVAVENEITLVEDLPPHPNIVRYFFHQRTERHLRLFMTKYAGTLSNFIEKKAEQNALFSPEQIKKFAVDIAKGLQYLHAHKIIHRDLKADNIFVTTNEKKEVQRCAVGDFDTAKKLSKDTVARTCIGTPSFIAPEVLTARERAGDYNFQADVYSYGMIIYECLTLKQPYSGIPPLQISMRIIKGERPELPELPSEYEPFVSLHLRCTEMEPGERPTLNALIKELEGLEL